MSTRSGVFVVSIVIAVAVAAVVAAVEAGTGRAESTRAGTRMSSRGSMSPAAGIPGLQKHPLTAAQTKEIHRIRSGAAAQVRSIRADRSLTAAARAKKIDRARREGHEKVLAVLTPEQRQEFEQWWSHRSDPPMGMGSMHMGMGSGHMSMGGSDGARASSDPSGKSIFANNCAVCHGDDGRKVAGWRAKVKKMTEAQIEQTIRKGGQGMPAFSQVLSDKQIKLVAGYAKQLASGK
jgi:mono/diheme cytochrome c family protein